MNEKNLKIMLSLFIIFGLMGSLFSEETQVENEIENENSEEEIIYQLEKEAELAEKKRIEIEKNTLEVSKKATGKERVKLDGSEEDSFYGKYYYNKYEEFYKSEEFFPLGYRAITELTYFEKQQQRQDKEGWYYWESVTKKEKGYFLDSDNETIAEFTIEYDKTGKITNSEEKGFSLLGSIFSVLAAILGVEAPTGDLDLASRGQSEDEVVTERVN